MNASLAMCPTDKPYLALEGSRGEFVSEKYRRWQGDEKTARELALTYGGVAVPKEWVARRKAEDDGEVARIPAEAAAAKAKLHRHDRTGEEIEP